MPVYKKPVFWVSIIFVIAILFAALFWAGNPATDDPAAEQRVEDFMESPDDEDYASILDNVDILTALNDISFNFTRIDMLDIDGEHNKQIYLLNEYDAGRLNAVLNIGEWAKAADVPAMGIEPVYMLYDRAGYSASINSWDDDRCLVVLRFDEKPHRIDLYYAPASVLHYFELFMSMLTPLPGNVSSEAERYLGLFANDTGFKILIDAWDDALSDSELAVYAILRMENYSYENGNTREEYDAITEKYLGMKIENFENGMTEFIPGTDRIRATGWDAHGSVYMILKSDVTQEPDGTYIGDFYAYRIPELFGDEVGWDYIYTIKEYLLTENTEIYPEPSIVRVKFELANEMRGDVQYEYLVYKSVTVLNNR